MDSSPSKTTCGICKGSLERQAMYTAECSHSFHFTCINNTFAINKFNPFCPICSTKWNNPPFSMPNFYNPPSNNINQSPFNFPSSPFGSVIDECRPVLESEPLQFSDDDPLLEPSSSSSTVGLQKVTVEAIPERQVVAASESVSLFTVLVKLKGPPLSAEARSSRRAPIDLVTVLDVSGSMHGNKLSLLKRAVNFVIDELGPSDRLSIVSFNCQARRMFRLSRMTDAGRRNAKLAVDSLCASGQTNIVEGLKKGAQVLEERRYKNPVSSIVFLSDGNDTCNGGWYARSSPPVYLSLLPPSIFPIKNSGPSEIETIPVHAFGFGSDHDPVTMHVISDASSGTFSFIQSYEMVQDAFASCIGGLLSVMTQGLRLSMRSASHGVEIKSIPSGRYSSEITDGESKGTIHIGDLYADEVKEFLINLSVPALLNPNEEETERKTSLLDIACSYKDIVSKEAVEIECDLVEIRRVKTVSPSEMAVNLEVDRQRNRLRAAESIAEAQKMAETGDLFGARCTLSKGRTEIFGSAAGQAGDSMSAWLGADMKETERRMGSVQQYQQEGRAFALAGMSAHGAQRATTKGKMVAGAGPTDNNFSFGLSSVFGAAPSGGGAFGAAAPAGGGLFGAAPFGGGAFGAAPSGGGAFGGGFIGAAPSGGGVFGAAASGDGVFGAAPSGGGVFGAAPSGDGVFGAAPSSNVFSGVFGGGGVFGAAPSSSVFSGGFGAASGGGFGGGFGAQQCAAASGGGFGGAYGGGAYGGAAYDPYATPSMANMVVKSQQVSKTMDDKK
ncbi:hypothetical protein ABFS82_06G182400 [Erythranthe guttata]|uniref:uncharacterized protein LOC105955587 n=1 Tax=Erythranthe guttata TaxID=4155 RepID=UPI00064DA4D4|nr:PREDICTED: uncharacterized protein LOC105955587 [Erythranthe guttata]|eukprot:XP_012834792.1 PREDICTED: uncharacterized protein LOC105955587 [Erythranthe guttata]